MKRRVICLLLLISCVAHARTWQYVDYDISMNMRQYGFVMQSEMINMHSIVGISNAAFNAFFKMLYERNNFLKVKPGATLKIPKKIHQIWLGGPVPDAFKAYMKSWQDMHPDWEYYLWTDENVHEVKLYNQAYYDSVPGNYGVQSDLLKWELIYQFGGVYVDTDFECLQPLDDFHYAYDFYTGIQPLDTRYVQLGAALFGAAPGNRILKHCIETIYEDWHQRDTVIKTGPVHFSKSFYKMAGTTSDIDIAMPAHYFYPLGSTQVDLKREDWIAQGAYAVHHWAKSWVNPLFRPQQFRVLNESEKWMKADFDELMQADLYDFVITSQAVRRDLGESGDVFYEACRSLYEQRNLSQVDLKFYVVRIPKMIHHIWLDSEIPEDVQRLMQTWHDKHQGWEHRIWRDADIKQLKKTSGFLYDHAWTHEQKMQIARYEVLAQYGGVVVDAHMECVRDVSYLHHGYDLYAALSPLHTRKLQIDAHIIGAIPHHPTIERSLMLAAELLYGQRNPEDDGSLHFTKNFMRTLQDARTVDIILPATYFYTESGNQPEAFARTHFYKGAL